VILAIDAGNSRTKWGVFDEAGQLEAKGAIPNSVLSGLSMPDEWQSCRRAVISNVAGEGVAECIGSLLGPLAEQACWVKPSLQACNVTNSYQFPERLGSDRWAAAIAAWHHYEEPCVVVNAGTALTVDAVGIGENGGGVFLGGLIIPGLRLMEASLVSETADISRTSGSLQYFPTSTGDAIYTGALTAMAGAVNSMLVRLGCYAGRKPYCILSGGEAPLLHEMLVRFEIEQLVVMEDLVLQGLRLLEKENRMAE
jgi:type III pantothenate kinase